MLIAKHLQYTYFWHIQGSINNDQFHKNVTDQDINYIKQQDEQNKQDAEVGTIIKQFV